MRVKHLVCMAILAVTVMACGLPPARQASPTVSLPVPLAPPTSTPAVTPTYVPTGAPTATPTHVPTRAPTAAPTMSATPVSVAFLTIRAYIDGRSQLVLQGGALRWHHLDFAAPGRHPDLREGEPTYLNGAAWCPAWPDSPDVTNLDCDCDSSFYAGIAPLATQDQVVGLKVGRARDRATIVQQPRTENGYTLIVEFDDNESPAADWYEVDIAYVAGGQAASAPIVDGQCLPTPMPVVVALVTPLPTPVPLPGALQPGATLGRPMTKDEMVMHYVPAGPFYMGSPEGVGDGSEHPQHVVTLGAFWIDETEVMAWQYQNCIGAGVCDVPPMDDYALGSRPIEVTWDAAQAYCRWVVGGRLPTEAEWEKAARSSDGRTYPWGEEQPDCSLANHASQTGFCSEGPVDAGTHPAGASPYGVQDMAGNVAEWVSDGYDPGYYAASPEQDPQGPDVGPERVVRGGAWDDTFSAIRAAYRGSRAPDERAGFRCVVPAAAYTVVESDLYEGWYRYTNLDYGFSFHYPPDWTLEERLHLLIFRHKALDTLYFSIVYQRVGEDRWVWRTGMPAGDFVPRASVSFLGREISRDVLVYEGKAKVVLYNYSSALPWDEIVFDFTLDDYSSDYDRVDLPEDVQDQIDQIVSSFELDGN